ncbi:hypothetical protein B0H34DRAFT_801019 [Crassisporium funariophilum]|nr:hypothetical protein B0H34DRAFT_801019 [Crassisporium funariophilum]
MPQFNTENIEEDKTVNYTKKDIAPFILAAKWTLHTVCPFVNLNGVVEAGLFGYDKADYKCRKDFEVDFTLYETILNLDKDFETAIEAIRNAPASRAGFIQTALWLILTGNSLAFTGHRSALKQFQAKIHGMRIYVNLLTLKQWSNMDSYFTVERFYKLIVGLFKEPMSRWAEEILEFLTIELPALKCKAKQDCVALIDDSEADKLDSDPTGILAQQAARLNEGGGDMEAPLPTVARTLLPPSRGAGLPSPSQPSPPLHQTFSTHLPAANAALARSQPSQRPQIQPQLLQSLPMHPEDIHKPLAPLNTTQGHAGVVQSLSKLSYGPLDIPSSVCPPISCAEVAHTFSG